MRSMRIRCAAQWMAASALLTTASVLADSPTTQIKTEYLMTILAPLDPSSDVNDSLFISNVRAAGAWAKGPRVQGTLVPPGGDWSRIMPSGSLRLDVRLTLKTDDGALIYMTYNGVMRESPENEKKAARGEVLTDKDIAYFITAPTFETAAQKYAWLNGIQAIGKMVEYKEGKDGYVK